MPYITSVERIGMEKGMEKEAMKILSRLVAKRFEVDPDFAPDIFFDLNTEEIEELCERFLEASSLDDIRNWAEEKRRARSQQ